MKFKEKSVQFFALFTSSGTLLCCALPAATAAVAGVTAVTSMLSALPWLIPLSRHKIWIFIISGLLIIISAVFTFRKQNHNPQCDIDGGEGCKTASGFSKFMFYFSLIIYLIGFFFAYLLVSLLRLMEV